MLSLLATPLIAAPQPAWYPSEAVVAAQQQACQKDIAEAQAYYERVLLGQYDSLNSKPDDNVRVGRDIIRANIRARIDGEDASLTNMRYLTNRLIGRTFDDPLVRYFYAIQLNERSNTGHDSVRSIQIEACNRLLDSGYKGLPRYYALVRLASLRGTVLFGDENTADMAEVEPLLTRALGELDAMSKDKDFPAAEIKMSLNFAQSTSMSLYKERWKFTSKAYDVLLKNLGPQANLLAKHAEMFTAYAWDARGDGYANTVTPEGWRLMEERLAIAEKDAKAAWAKDPKCLAAAQAMMGIELGQGKGRKVMELWFGRAIALDPTNAVTIDKMRYYLEPRWHGEEGEAIAFAREAAACLPKTSRARLLLAGALFRDAGFDGPIAAYPFDKIAILKTHPAIWEELKPVADDVCLEPSSDPYDRVLMARLAAGAGDKDSARKYLQSIDDAMGLAIAPDYDPLKRFLGLPPAARPKVAAPKRN